MNRTDALPPRQPGNSILPFFSSTIRFLGRAVVPLAAVLALAGGPARALDRSAYSLEILVNGMPLSEYAARGTTYVEALEGAEYTVRLSNRTGERVAVALSVDGLNSIDAKTSDARSARKWILGPWETIDLDGWQTSASTARRFFFTTERESYGAWLGKTKNLGIISAAVFREKRPVAIALPQEERFDRAAAAPAPSRACESDAAAEGTQSKAEARRKLSDELAATGIGREMNHEVRRVSFDPEETPAAVLDLRYEYHDALVRLGVLPRFREDDALTRRERSTGFDDLVFAPDPYRPRSRR